jgi:hypothetical protein
MSLVMDLEIIDNFLSNHEFQSIEKTLMGEWFPWYYNPFILQKEKESGKSQFTQFTHTFFSVNPPYNGNNSRHFDLLIPCLKKLRCYGLHRIKANLTQGTIFHKRTGYHTDSEDMITAVLYINTCNGYTRFKKGKNVKSVANRMVIFDSNLQHCGVTSTNSQRRVVINFNFRRE